MLKPGYHITLSGLIWGLIGLILSFWPGSSVAQPLFAGCDVLTQIPEAECDALEIMFNKLDGEHWAIRGGWLLAGQPCEWAGVVCATGPWPRNVKKIVLIDNNLGGTIPGEISFLTELEELVLVNTATAGYFNIIGGFLPDAIGEMENLEILRISGHAIKGPLPVDLTGLKSIRVMDFSSNELDGPIPANLAQLTTLEELNLSSNNFRGLIPDSLGYLENLSKLNLSENDIIGSIPSTLGQLSNLTVLELQSNNLIGAIPDSFSGLSNLISLTLTDNNLDRPPPPNVIKLFSKLPICSIQQNNPRFCIPDAPIYSDLGDQNAICEVPLQASCSYCSSASDIPHGQCQGLESLFYQTNGLNWTTNDGWLSEAPACEWFGVGCAEENVTRLAIPDNNLDGAIPEELGSLSELNTLDLSGNELKGEVPLSVAQFQNTSTSCKLNDNDISLCIPNDPAYKAISEDSICGIPVALSCRITPSSITFESFETVPESPSEILLWRMNLSVPDAYFEIEQKIDGAFRTIGSVNMPVGPDAPLSYSYPLDGLDDGLHTFRVRMVLSSGSYVFSPELTVAFFNEKVHVMASPFPNPATNTATFRFSVNVDQPVRASLYDVTGRLIRTIYDGTTAKDVVEEISFSVSNLPNGLYFIQLEGNLFRDAASFVVAR